MPRWPVLLLPGTAAGAAIVPTAHERYVPQRLLAHASEQLRSGAVAVCAGRFTLKGGQLDFSVVLTRQLAVVKPLTTRVLRLQ